MGVIVASLDRAKAFLGGVLGLPLVKETDIAGKTRAAFYRCGTVEIEAIEPLTEAARAARLGAGNEARVEHIAIAVGSLPALLAHLGASGGQMDAAPLDHGGDLMSFSVPASTMGVRFQFIEKGAGSSDHH